MRVVGFGVSGFQKCRDFLDSAHVRKTQICTIYGHMGVSEN